MLIINHHRIAHLFCLPKFREVRIPKIRDMRFKF